MGRAFVKHSMMPGLMVPEYLITMKKINNRNIYWIYYSMMVWSLVQLSCFLQESAIFLARILLPQIFEKLTMQDLRALIVERSTMKTYLGRETIEIPYHSVGFLLEGFVKTYNLQELITSPAALVPSQGNQSFTSIEESGNLN